MTFEEWLDWKGGRQRGQAARRELVADVRDQVIARERGLCRAWVDGHRFPWCQRVGAEMHEIVARGAGGRVSLDNSILLCHACHEKRHGIGAWLRILGTAAAVTFIARQRSLVMNTRPA
jgi:hypothetical protein